MQDVLKEIDLSAGAVYRYFSGKEELIGAIVSEVLQEVRGRLSGRRASRTRSRRRT